MTAAEPAASGGLLAAMRPRQWTKNLLLYAGIVFAAELDDPERWVQATAAFVAYCLASSAAYIFNDVRDAERDRLHPLKRHRPIASGRVRPELARARCRRAATELRRSSPGASGRRRSRRT